jgi:hypothetical protein
VARQSRAQQERNARLKALMTQVPEGTDIAALVFAFVDPPSMTPRLPHPAGDRHAAICCAAAIEHALKKAISLYLAKDADLKAVFEEYPNAPLSSFAARTTLARALGIINDRDEADLVVIRRIRNTFAHSVLPISFGDADLAHLVTEIQRLKDPMWESFDTQFSDPRDRYVMSCAIHYTALWKHFRPATTEALTAALLALPQTPPPQSLLESTPADRTGEAP